ncbi:MAG TPA: hypothetical protein PLH82_02810 [Candidatus Paceibacterota bacterium]|jgi:hypothetical protein|nr:hypothetical protein [Candidatus Paceibacterota bacterium]
MNFVFLKVLFLRLVKDFNNSSGFSKKPFLIAPGAICIILEYFILYGSPSK